MTSMLRIFAAAAALAAVPAAVQAQDAPALTGDWVGQTYTIVAGKGGHWPESAGTFEKPGLFNVDITITITGQEDRKFWGKSILHAEGGPTEEPFIGELMSDGKTVMIADTDGYFTGTIDGDTFSYCYAQAGGPSGSSVVSCTEVTRKP